MYIRYLISLFIVKFKIFKLLFECHGISPFSNICGWHLPFIFLILLLTTATEADPEVEAEEERPVMLNSAISHSSTIIMVSILNIDKFKK